MDKQDIINYVLDTPTNTNPAVLSGMLDSLGGGIEMITLFDDDIPSFTYTPGSQSGPAYGSYFGTLSNPVADSGIIRVTYENKSAFGLYTSSSGFSATINISESPVQSFQINPYSSLNSFHCNISSLNPSVESEFEAYCQEPHHLKIEWFPV